MPITEDFLKHLMAHNAAMAAHVKTTVQYGPNLQALVIVLNTVGAVSINHTHKILGSVFSIPLATRTIKNMVSRFAGSLSGAYERIRQQITALGLIHCVETGTRADGKTCWVHNASNADYTVLSIHKKIFDKQYDEIIKTAYAENPLPETTDKNRQKEKG